MFIFRITIDNWATEKRGFSIFRCFSKFLFHLLNYNEIIKIQNIFLMSKSRNSMEMLRKIFNEKFENAIKSNWILKWSERARKREKGSKSTSSKAAGDKKALKMWKYESKTNERESEKRVRRRKIFYIFPRVVLFMFFSLIPKLKHRGYSSRLKIFSLSYSLPSSSLLSLSW